MTDNRNRTVSEIRNLFGKNGGSLGENGCVAWMFERRGYFLIEAGEVGEERLVELAVELGAEDFSVDDDGFHLYTSAEDYATVREALEERDDVPVAVRQLAMVPQSQVPVGEEEAGGVLRLLELLEDHDDVQNVWANCDLPADTPASDDPG